jgi:hypothetical protein
VGGAHFFFASSFFSSFFFTGSGGGATVTSGAPPIEVECALGECRVHPRRSATELVDQVVFGLVGLGEPDLAATAEVVEVLVLHRVAEARLERATRRLFLRLGRIVECAVIRSPELVVLLDRVGDGSRAELVHERAPHVSDLSAGDDPRAGRNWLKITIFLYSFGRVSMSGFLPIQSFTWSGCA